MDGAVRRAGKGQGQDVVEIPERRKRADRRGPALPCVLCGPSPAMQVIAQTIRNAAHSRAGVLIAGESGTGREQVARTIHAQGERPDAPFVKVDCARVLSELEPGLFGVMADPRRPAANGSLNERVGGSGLVYRARGGTLFLVNIGDAPARVQSSLARLLRDREAILEEEGTLIDLDVRPIAAVEPAVEASVQSGRFHGDLFNQLSRTRIDVPALRRRREDIPVIAGHILQEICDARSMTPKHLTQSALALLSALPWNRNIGELRDLLELLAQAIEGPDIQLDDVLAHVRLDGGVLPVEAGRTLKDARDRFERDYIIAALLAHRGRVGEAARALGIQRANLYRKVRRLKMARSLLANGRS